MNYRKASVKDVPQILGLINELAEFEYEPQEVVVTEKSMIADGFSENPIYHTFIAENENEILGIAIYYFAYSTWKGRIIHLEDLVVKEDHRRKGIGQELFNLVRAEAKKLNVKRMQWQVLNWNTNAIEFYEKQNAIIDKEWYNGKLTYELLQE